jgi:hypothetical protein
MKVKKMVIFLTIFTLILSQNVFAFAEKSPIINQTAMKEVVKPLWDNANDVKLSLYFTDNNAECLGTIEGVTGTSSISATFKLERKGLFGWTVENSWTKSERGQSLSFYGTLPVTKGTYRLSVTAKVTVNGVTETVTTSVQAVK